MHQEQVDMVAGDFNGAAWRRRSGNEQRRNSTIERAFANTILPIPHGPTALWGPGGVPGEWPMCGGSSSHPVSKLSGIFACTVRSKLIMKFLESNLPTRVATTRYGFISCMSTHACLVDRASRDGQYRRPAIRKRKQSVRPQEESRGHPRKKITCPSA